MYKGDISNVVAPTLAINIDGLILTKPRAFPGAVKRLEKNPWTTALALHLYEINSDAYLSMERLVKKYGYNFIFIAYRPKSVRDVFKSFFRDWPVLDIYCVDDEFQVGFILEFDYVVRYFYTQAEHYVFRHAHKCRRVLTWSEVGLN